MESDQPDSDKEAEEPNALGASGHANVLQPTPGIAEELKNMAATAPPPPAPKPPTPVQPDQYQQVNVPPAPNYSYQQPQPAAISQPISAGSTNYYQPRTSSKLETKYLVLIIVISIIAVIANIASFIVVVSNDFKTTNKSFNVSKSNTLASMRLSSKPYCDSAFCFNYPSNWQVSQDSTQTADDLVNNSYYVHAPGVDYDTSQTQDSINIQVSYQQGQPVGDPKAYYQTVYSGDHSTSAKLISDSSAAIDGLPAYSATYQDLGSEDYESLIVKGDSYVYVTYSLPNANNAAFQKTISTLVFKKY